MTRTTLTRILILTIATFALSTTMSFAQTLKPSAQQIRQLVEQLEAQGRIRSSQSRSDDLKKGSDVRAVLSAQEVKSSPSNAKRIAPAILVATRDAEGKITRTQGEQSVKNGVTDESFPPFLYSTNGNFFLPYQEFQLTLTAIREINGPHQVFARLFRPRPDGDGLYEVINAPINNLGDGGFLEHGMHFFDARRNVFEKLLNGSDAEGAHFLQMIVIEWDTGNVVQDTTLAFYYLRSNTGGRSFPYVDEATVIDDIRGTSLLVRGNFPKDTSLFVMLGKPDWVNWVYIIRSLDGKTVFLPGGLHLPYTISMDVSVLSPATNQAFGKPDARVFKGPFER